MSADKFFFREARKQSNSGEMPFLDHLEELRWRLIWSLLALVVGSDWLRDVLPRLRTGVLVALLGIILVGVGIGAHTVMSQPETTEMYAHQRRSAFSLIELVIVIAIGAWGLGTATRPSPRREAAGAAMRTGALPFARRCSRWRAAFASM